MKRLLLATATCLAVGFAFPALADDDYEHGGDDAVFNNNTLLPEGEPQHHDLDGVGHTGGIDVDIMAIPLRRNRSYEALLTSAGLDVELSNVTRRIATPPYTTVLQTATEALGSPNTYSNASLRWISSVSGEEKIWVTTTAAHTALDKYTIKLRETTLYCPRFNNSGTQTSVLIVQKAVLGTCSVQSFFYSAGGSPLYSSALTPIADDATVVTSLAAIGALAGTSGAAQIAHTCGIGGIKAKLVALEPSTGFSFDTQCTTREN